MLIGCCHCGEPSESAPSGSVQPSESVASSAAVSQASQSVVSSGSVYIPPGDCGACDGSNGYRPSQFEITWNLVDQSPPSDLFDIYTETGGCYEFYQGPFQVNENNGKAFNDINVNGLPPGAIECVYGTDAYPLYSSSCAAAEPFNSTNCRAYLWLVKNDTADYRIYVLIYWVNEGGPAESLAEGGIWYISDALTALNCFGSYTLNYLYMHNTQTDAGYTFSPGPGYNYEYTDSNASPVFYEFTFPETISIAAL